MKSPFPDLDKLISTADFHTYDHGRYDEIVQMLADLAYLSISAEDGKIVERDELRDAVRLFREESVHAKLIRPVNLSLPFPDDPQKNPPEILTYREFSLLQLLVSLDGDFNIVSFDRISDTPLLCRVLQYRLYLMGLVDDRPNGCSNVEIWKALGRLNEWLKPLNEAELLDFTGDIWKLVRRLRAGELVKQPLAFFKDNQEKSYSKYYRIDENNTAFTDRVGNDIGRKSSAFRNLKKLGKQKEIFPEQLAEDCSDSFCRFSVRVAQIIQWVSGHYSGAIDGRFGSFTFESFLQLAQIEKERENVDFKIECLLGYAGNLYWIVNLHYLFGELSENVDAGEGAENVFDSYRRFYDSLDEKERSQVDENVKKVWKQVNFDQRANMQSSNFRFRRIYLGARSLLRSFGRGVKSIFSWLKKKITNWATDLFNLVRNFVKYLFREIREALRLFARGLHFLFSDREIVSEGWLTKFDFDMDSATYLTQPLTEEIVQDHKQKIATEVSGLWFCLTLTGKIIHFIILTGLGWQNIVVQAGILLKNLVKDCFADRKFDGFTVNVGS